MKLRLGNYIKYKGENARVVGVYDSWSVVDDDPEVFIAPVKGGHVLRHQHVSLKYVSKLGYDSITVSSSTFPVGLEIEFDHFPPVQSDTPASAPPPTSESAAPQLTDSPSEEHHCTDSDSTQPQDVEHS